MSNKIIDQRVQKILRWSLGVQIFVLFQSSLSPLMYDFLRRKNPVFKWTVLIPVVFITFTLILLSLKRVQSRITKKAFLVVLYLIAITTILTRNLAISGDFRGPNKVFPVINMFRGGWETIFFLIIPLVFIAWQYSMREVFVYCFAIVFFENIPIILPGRESDPVFPLINFVGDVARSMTMLIVGWIMHQLVKVQREQHAQLDNANRKLRKYALTSEKLAQTQERNRLARELHDTLAHTLSSVSVQLEATKSLFDRDPNSAKKILDETLVNTKNGLKETRRTIVDLRASELDTYGLTQAIRNIGESAAERGGFAINFKLDKNQDLLPDDVAHSLYRTVQEALENTLRHANAANVSVNLLAAGNTTRMEISDDGQGFDYKDVSSQNLGIRGMRERIEMLGGEFKIDSNSQSGTEIIVTLEQQDD